MINFVKLRKFICAVTHFLRHFNGINFTAVKVGFYKLGTCNFVEVYSWHKEEIWEYNESSYEADCSRGHVQTPGVPELPYSES